MTSVCLIHITEYLLQEATYTCLGRTSYRIIGDYKEEKCFEIHWLKDSNLSFLPSIISELCKCLHQVEETKFLPYHQSSKSRQSSCSDLKQVACELIHENSQLLREMKVAAEGEC